MDSRKYAIRVFDSIQNKNSIPALLFITILIFWIRSSGFIFSAQFWAEDGVLYFRDAWENGLSSLLMPYVGYYVLTIRIGALFSTLFPIENAPLVCAILAFFLQLLPCYLIFSTRTNKILPNTYLKWCFAMVYLIGPGPYEIFVTITNIQWYLPVWVFLFLFSEPSEHKIIRILEYVVLFLFSLTGPYVIFIFPIYIGLLLLKKLPFNKVISAILGACFILQFWSLSRSPSMPSVGFIEYDTLLKYISSKMIISGLIGIKGQRGFFGNSPTLLVFITGLILWLYISIRVLFSKNYFLIVLIALGNLNFISGYIKVGHQMSFDPEVGARYAWVGVLAYSFSYFYLAFKIKNWIEKSFLYVLILVTLTIGIASDFNYFNPKNEDWAKNVKVYSWANKGDTVIIKTNPANFDIKLVKKTESEIPNLKSTDNILMNFSFDMYNDSLFTKDGWAVLRDQNSNGNEIYVFFRSYKRSYVFKTIPYTRADISNALKGDYDLAGFNLSISTADIDENKYSTGVFIYNKFTGASGLTTLNDSVEIVRETRAIVNHRMELAKFNYVFDLIHIENNHLRLRGWAILAGIPSTKTVISVNAKSINHTESIPIQHVLRPDVSQAFSGGYNLSGFSADENLNDLPEGDYVLEIQFKHGEYTRVVDTDKFFKIR